MGLSPSKELGQLDLNAEFLQECFTTHSTTLETIKESIQAQKLAVDMLTKLESCKQTHGTEESEEEKGNYDRIILSNIQRILMVQCDLAKNNFKHLQQCLYDTIEKVCEKKTLSPKWEQLTNLLHSNAHLTEYTATASDSSLSKYSPNNVSKVFESVEDLHKRHDKKETDYQLNKKCELDKKYQDMLRAKDDQIYNEQRNVRSKATEIRRLQEDLRVQHDENDNLRRSLDSERQETSSLQKDIRDLQRTNQRLEEKIRVKPKVPVQLYYLRNDELMMAVVHELQTMLNTQCSSLHNFEVEIQHRTKANDIQPNTPVLALCINASRLGTDAAGAIHGLKSSNQIAMLLFHHKDVHAIPSQRSERMLTGQEFKDLGGIFDLVFLRGKGIYTCDLNNEAIRSITNFIKS